MSTERPEGPITWRNSVSYSPVQERSGIKAREELDFPPARRRTSQHPDPFNPPYLDEREVLRVTYQGDDRCQLACPGCYTGERLRQSPAMAARAGRRKVVDESDFTGQVTALGPGLQDFFLIGAEPTVDPAGSASKLAWAAERGLSIMSITNGAVDIQRFEATFGASIRAGMYKLNISLDSMVPSVHNVLRGRSYAHKRTLAIIRHCMETNVPFKIQMTVWPLNYTTILDSVRELYDLGVRGFAFHCGSLEGVTNPDRYGLDHIDPLAWRALVEQLIAFRDAHWDEWTHFNVPLLYFTETELRTQVIGEDELTDAYVEHVDRLEAGKDSVKPVQGCPALDVPQVYVYANDGPESRGTASLCQIHVAGKDVAYAHYIPELRRWGVIQDPARNQMQHMIDSPHLCPATPGATGRASDRVLTEAGPLYHACRYIGSNQIPIDYRQFGSRIYRDACAFYGQVARMLTDGTAGWITEVPSRKPGIEWPIARVRRLTSDVLRLADRADVLATAAIGPQQQ